MLEGRFQFSRMVRGVYTVRADVINGKMEFVGTVHKVDRPMHGGKWQARFEGKTIGFASTRLEAAKILT